MPDFHIAAFSDAANLCGGTSLRWPMDDSNLKIRTKDQYRLSHSHWAGLNLAQHVEDEYHQVLRNRELFESSLKMPSKPFWLNQVHGTELVKVSADRVLAHEHNIPMADGSYSFDKKVVLAVMTADCLPILMSSINNDWIGAIHCGWRSLAGGIITKLLNKAPVAPSHIKVWLGPAISQKHFQVGEDVRQAFLPYFSDDDCLQEIFTPDPNYANKYFADLYVLAKMQLTMAGVLNVSGGEYCTYSNPEKFYSYRRQKKTGRMLTFIWMKS